MFPRGWPEIPHPLNGAVAAWISQEIGEPARTLLSRLVPDGPRGVHVATKALITLSSRQGWDTELLEAAASSVQALPLATKKPYVTKEPLSYYLCCAAGWPAAIDHWTFEAMPTLWEARAVHERERNSNLRAVADVYQRVHAIVRILNGMKNLDPVPALAGDRYPVETAITAALEAHLPPLDAHRIRDAKARGRRVFHHAALVPHKLASDLDFSDIGYVLPKTRRNLARVDAAAPEVDGGPRRDRHGQLSTASLLGMPRLPRISSHLGFCLLSQMLEETAEKEFLVPAVALARWVALTGQTVARALSESRFSASDESLASITLRRAADELMLGWTPDLNDLALVGHPVMSERNMTQDEFAQLSGQVPPHQAVDLDHYLDLAFTTPDAHERLVDWFVQCLSRIENRYPVVGPNEERSLLMEFLAWTATRESRVAMPDAEHVHQLGLALSHALQSTNSLCEPLAADRINRAAAAFDLLAVLGVRAFEELPAVRAQHFDEVAGQLVIPKTKYYPEGRVLPLPTSQQSFLAGFLRARREHGYGGYLFSAPEIVDRPAPGAIYHELLAVAREHGYTGPEPAVRLYRHAALTAQLDLARDHPLLWMVKASLAGHSAWLLSCLCDVSWSDVVGYCEPVWRQRLADVGLLRPTRYVGLPW